MDYLIRNMHFIVIHVPIAMLVFSFLFDVLAIAMKRREWHSAGLLCLVVGAAGAVAAVLSGPEEERNALFPRHELFGKITMFVAIALVLIRLLLLWKKKLELGRNVFYLVAALILVGLVTYTGHLGGKMVHPDRGEFPGGGNFPPGGFNRDQGGQPGQGGGAGTQGQRPGGQAPGTQRQGGQSQGQQAPATQG